MTTFIITIAAGFILSAMWLAFMMMAAPEGWEDERGWHAGRPDDLDSEG